jgi:DNA invertase Pin-like site-specific DNA recombinase
VSGVAETALETLRRCVSALASGRLTDQDRLRAAELASAALELVDVAASRRVPVDRQAAAVVSLEANLVELPPAERCRRICRHLGISRATYYRLRRRQSQCAETGRVERRLQP